MILDCAKPENTGPDETALKRSASPLRISREDVRPLKQIKFENTANLTEEMTILTEQELKVEKTDGMAILTNQLLKQQFKLKGILGRCIGDCSSMVFAVKSLENKEKKALKITDSFPPLEVLSKVKDIWEKGESIHLTETVLLGKIQVCFGAYLDRDRIGDGFVVAPRAKQNRERWAYVYLMPLKDGDLKALKKKGLSMTEEAAIEVVRVATEAFLNRQGIEPVDMKDINILTRPLTIEDCFGGKRILDYDYLKYTIESENYYLPVGENLITLCDYDKWMLTQRKLNFTGVLEQRLRRSPQLLAEIKKFKTTPPKRSTILSMQ